MAPSLTAILADAPGSTPAERAAFSRGWLFQRARGWIDTARHCRRAGDRRRAAMHLGFAAELRRDGLAISIPAAPSTTET